MTDPQSYRPKTSDIPTEPGVYRFFSDAGQVLYVGKAKNLRNRIVNYFQDLAVLHPRTQSMVTSASKVEWTVVSSEVAALALEFAWIKEFDPKFNVMWKDDASYPYLAISLGEAYPAARVTRDTKAKNTTYYGPYTDTWAIRQTTEALLQVFPIRTCSDGTFSRAKRSGRACLLAHIDKCSAPCIGKVSMAEHQELAQSFNSFMSGQTGNFLPEMKAKMQLASDELRFEDAAKYRDALTAVTKVMQQHEVALSSENNVDIYGLEIDGFQAAVAVFYVRKGRIIGQRNWVLDNTEDSDEAGVITKLIEQLYGEVSNVRSSPSEIIVPAQPAGQKELTNWLETIHEKKIAIKSATRGPRHQLVLTAKKNAFHALQLHKNKRAADIVARGQALLELQESLGLAESPLRIECYDISHTQGNQPVGSMVVFEDGLPKPKDYRTFSIRFQNSETKDDTAAIHEVISRRFTRLQDSENEPENTSFAYRPSLLVIDGGQPQVAAASRALAELGEHNMAVCGLAKRLEEVWLPEDDYPVLLSRSSEALFLLQRVRDEAHRFALKTHRKQRGKSVISSRLDGIAGIGPAKQKALLKKFGSVKRIEAASAKEIAETPGISLPLAETVLLHLKTSSK